MDNSKRKFRSKRRCLRQPPKNRYVLAAEKRVVPESFDESEIEVRNSAATPGTSKYKFDTSTTANELLVDSIITEQNENISGFRLIDIELLQMALQTFAMCKFCKIGFLSIVENCEKSKMGMANKWQFHCNNGLCSKSCEFYTSKKCGRGFEVNRRLVLGMSTIGKGFNALVSVCNDLNIPPPMNAETFSNNFDVIRDVTVLEAKDSMNRAAVQEHVVIGADEMDIVNCQAMFDGTWRKRGHSSMQGGVTAISASTGKCLDYEPLNKVCKGCRLDEKFENDNVLYEQWKANHSHKCAINYTGSAPSMEPIGIKRIYDRSEVMNKLRYTGYIGDGDTKSFSNINDSRPYGDIAITKLECVGHVQKRMGTALRNLKKSWGPKKLADGKTMGGKGRLTDVRIDKLQIYYGLAIRRNKGELVNMKKEVEAGLLHSSSTNANPQHGYCPEGVQSWCKWQKCKAARQDLYCKLTSENKTKSKKKIQQEVERLIPSHHHTDPLPPAIVTELKPIYSRLSRDDLLERCLDGFTQNRCESINQLIWLRCPKQTSSGRTQLDFAMADAICHFNDGKGSHASILKRLGISPGKYSLAGFLTKDNKRTAVSIGRANLTEKKIRQSKRQKRKTAEELLIEREGAVYGAGIAD